MLLANRQFCHSDTEGALKFAAKNLANPQTVETTPARELDRFVRDVPRLCEYQSQFADELRQWHAEARTKFDVMARMFMALLHGKREQITQREQHGSHDEEPKEEHDGHGE